MSSVVPFAEEMLARHREFYPFGGTMSASGEIAHMGGWTGDEHPPSEEIVALLEDGFREGAVQGRYKATALVVDVLVIPPGKSVKQDAIAVRLDHRDSYSVQVLFPYSFSSSGELLVEDPFAVKGEGRIFVE
jgi:hypothetical protein